jgi:hypothetical protein
MQIAASAQEREQERLAMVATLESLRLHYRAELDEVYSGADEQLGRRITTLESDRGRWTEDQKSAVAIAIGNHSDALRAWRALTFWGRLRWLVRGC